jgi:hypothetical protein
MHNPCGDARGPWSDRAATITLSGSSHEPSPKFTEVLITGMNLFVFGTFLAWRLLGPGRPQRQEKPEPMASEETEITHWDL